MSKRKNKDPKSAGNPWTDGEFKDITQMPKAQQGDTCPVCQHGKLGRKAAGTLECAFCSERFKEGKQKGGC